MLISTPFLRPAISPLNGSHESKMLLMRPVPRVRFRNSVEKPISPRAGMRYSRRTRPMPSVSMLTSSARRSPSACITAPWCWSSTSQVTSSIGSFFTPPSSWKTTRGLLTASS